LFALNIYKFFLFVYTNIAVFTDTAASPPNGNRRLFDAPIAIETAACLMQR